MQGSPFSGANQESPERQHRLQPAKLNSVVRSGPLLRGSTTCVVAVVDHPGRPEDVPCLWGAVPGPTTCHTSRRAGGSSRPRARF